MSSESVANLFELRDGKVTGVVVCLERSHTFFDLSVIPRDRP